MSRLMRLVMWKSLLAVVFIPILLLQFLNITEQNTKPLMLSATQAPKQLTTYQPITLLF